MANWTNPKGLSPTKARKSGRLTMVNEADPTSGLSAIVCHGWPFGVNVATLLVPCCHTPTSLFAHDDGGAATAFPATKIRAEAPSARDQNILAPFVSRRRMGRELPALVPVAGNHFRNEDRRGRLFRLDLENEPVRQTLLGFFKIRRAETDTLGPVAFPPAAIPSGATCPLGKPEDPKLEAAFLVSSH
jgi:hypothetical protein